MATISLFCSSWYTICLGFAAAAAYIPGLTGNGQTSAIRKKSYPPSSPSPQALSRTTLAAIIDRIQRSAMSSDLVSLIMPDTTIKSVTVYVVIGAFFLINLKPLESVRHWTSLWGRSALSMIIQRHAGHHSRYAIEQSPCLKVDTPLGV
jgi:hypothetical protein